jgi:hypothetical protein
MKKGIQIIQRQELICEYCKCSFILKVNQKGKFCSRECFYKGRNKGYNTSYQICIGCSKQFKAYSSNNRKYCTTVCFYDSTRDSRIERALEIRSSSTKWTWYGGKHMRSTWEAKCAELLDSVGIKWVYEPQRFDLQSGLYYNKSIKGKKVWTYLPDFYLPEFNIYLEVKGWMTEESQRKIDRFRELGFHLVIVRGDDLKGG